MAKPGRDWRVLCLRVSMFWLSGVLFGAVVTSSLAHAGPTAIGAPAKAAHAPAAAPWAKAKRPASPSAGVAGLPSPGRPSGAKSSGQSAGEKPQRPTQRDPSARGCGEFAVQNESRTWRVGLKPSEVRQGKGVAILCSPDPGNIGHAFHESIQHYIKRTVQDPSIKAWITQGVAMKWYGTLLTWCAEHLGVRLISTQKAAIAEGLEVIRGVFWRTGDKSKWLVNGGPSNRPDRCPSQEWQHKTKTRSPGDAMFVVLAHVRCAAWSKVGAPDPRKAYSLLHTRADAARRRLVEWENIGCRFDKLVHDMVLALPEQVRLFAGAHTVVGPVGSGFTNLIFMQPTAVAIEILQAGQVGSSSWQFQYGTCQAVAAHWTIAADTMRAWEGAKSIRSHSADDDIVVTEELALKICDKMRVSPCMCQQRL